MLILLSSFLFISFRHLYINTNCIICQVYFEK
nr:MAG TPA: hypothetical protein [Caudoviricetes sp.]